MNYDIPGGLRLHLTSALHTFIIQHKFQCRTCNTTLALDFQFIQNLRVYALLTFCNSPGELQ
jgi:hypothetical protein